MLRSTGELEKRGDDRKEAGCRSSATCEPAVGTVCLVCGSVWKKAEKLHVVRNRPSGMRDGCPKSCLGFMVSPDAQFIKTMDIASNDQELVHKCTHFNADKLSPVVSPADIPLLSPTVITCGTRRSVSHQVPQELSPVLSLASLSKTIVPCAFDRQQDTRDMFSGIGVKRTRQCQSSRSGAFFLLLIASLSGLSTATMEITAFEYQRKFHKPLDLGECSQREVTVDMGNNTFFIEEQRCTLQQRGVVTHLPRELNDSRNVLISSADGIVAYLGLCGGEAASFLGILNSGDCVAVEIASRLTFSNKTMVRAFVGYYRKSLDILEGSGDTLEGMDRYYKDKFYLKNRSYGTLEIIFVQFRFESVLDTEEAKKIELSSPTMSSYMRQIHKKIGISKNVVVISLSTATTETYELKQFKKEDWERAVRYVEILELTIQRTRDLINTNAIMPHLQYQLYPFMDSGGYRLTKPVLWEKTSMLEVQLRQAVNLAKKTSKKCKKNQTKLCRRVRQLRRTVISDQAEIHKGRSNWVSLTTDEKNFFATRYTTRVISYSNLAKTLAKDVREMKIKEKAEKLERKQKRLNQIPLPTNGGSQKRHRIRHARSRGKVRKGQGS